MAFKNFKIPTLAAAACALTLAGCQFGNRDVTSLSGYDTISGYYASLPQSITFHAQVGTGAPRDQAALVNQMPNFMKAVMANPVMLYFDDPIGGSASLRSHTSTGIGLGTVLNNAASTFGAASTAHADVSGCRFQQQITDFGKFNQAPPSTISGLNVRGNLSLDYVINYSLIGDDVDCDAMRATFKNCYESGTGCSADSSSIFYRAFLTEVFDPFVNSGVITADEIASTRGISYHAVYQ